MQRKNIYVALVYLELIIGAWVYVVNDISMYKLLGAFFTSFEVQILKVCPSV